jgi:hypothetical protein
MKRKRRELTPEEARRRAMRFLFCCSCGTLHLGDPAATTDLCAHCQGSKFRLASVEMVTQPIPSVRWPRPLSAEDIEKIRRAAVIDWTKCPDVELSGLLWRMKGTQIPVRAILDDAEAECSAEEADPDESLPLVALRRHIGRRIDAVRRILLFAYQSEVTAIIGPAGSAPPMSAEAQARLRTLARRVLALRPFT